MPTLIAQDLACEDFEVLVIDNGSSDGTPEFLATFSPPFAFRRFEVKRRGAGAARNAGIFAARGKLILFLDDDLLAIPNLLSQHCAAHEGVKEQHVVHGPIFVSPDSVKTITRHVTEQFYEAYNGSLTADMELRYPEGIGSRIAMLSSMVNSSMPREAVLRCGGFDEDLRAAEDLDLGLRLWKMGLPFHCLPTACVREFYVKSSSDYLRNQAAASGAGDWRVVHKHPEYRPYSSLATFGETRIGRRWQRNLFMRFPLSPVPAMSAMLSLERFFYDVEPFRKFGVRIFDLAERIQRLRSGLQTAASWERLVSDFDRRLPVLMYHHVGPSRPGVNKEWSITPQQFERHVRRIRRGGYETILPSNWFDWLREGKPLPQKPVLITFDDGYSDTAQYALPILRRYGMTAAVYVVTGRIGGTNTWDEVQGSGTLQLMTAEEIRHWSDRGIEFGAHSRSHADLTTLSVEEVEEEVSGSRDDLALLLGSPPVSFAYPFGTHTEAIREVVTRSFGLAFGSEEGQNFLRCERHLLKRTYIGACTSTLSLWLILKFGGVKKLYEWRAKIALRTRFRRIFGLSYVRHP